MHANTSVPIDQQICSSCTTNPRSTRWHPAISEKAYLDQYSNSPRTLYCITLSRFSILPVLNFCPVGVVVCLSRQECAPNEDLDGVAGWKRREWKDNDWQITLVGICCSCNEVWKYYWGRGWLSQLTSRTYESKWLSTPVSTDKMSNEEKALSVNEAWNQIQCCRWMNPNKFYHKGVLSRDRWKRREAVM